MMNGIKQNQFDLKITAFPRIHMTLIGMNSNGYRINGGIGFSITDPKIYNLFRVSKKCSIIDNRENGFTIKEIERLKLIIDEVKRKYDFNKTIDCFITGESMTHFGLGTSTAIYLSCIEALFKLNNRECDELLLQAISSRGGTSGIGINTYFKGGCVFDAGISIKKDHKLEPSSISTARKSLPLIIKHLKTPPWNIGVLLPIHIKSKSELEEITFFKRTCPIQKTKVESILYEVLYGSLCSIMEKNYNDFCCSINAIQKTKWKQEERKLYGTEISKLEAILLENGALGVGMSSLGPGLYFFSENLDQLQIDLKNNHKIQILTAKMNNDSRIIEYD